MFFILILLTLTGCRAATNEPVTVSDFLLNTYVSITIYDTEKKELAEKALDLCRRYEQIFSRTQEGSALFELNNVKQVTDADPELFELIETGLFYCELSGGCLDISTEPLTSLWNVTAKNPSVPDSETIALALERVDYNNVVLDKANFSITLKNNSSLDLGAIAKGYIADKIKDFLVENGITSGTINLGGNIVCIGTKPDGTNYNIAIKEPVPGSNQVIRTLSVNDMSIVTSGTYERFFEENGTTYHHIIDPSTGYPSDSGLISATIISDKSVIGDCLSTACLVMGCSDALKFINSIDGVEAILIDENMQIYYTDGAFDLLR